MKLTLKQKVISLFSSFCLAFAMVPTAAFAAGEGAAKIDAAYPYTGFLNKGEKFDESNCYFALYIAKTADVVDGVAVDKWGDYVIDQNWVDQVVPQSEVAYCMDVNAGTPKQIKDARAESDFNLYAKMDPLAPGTLKEASTSAKDSWWNDEKAKRGLAWVALNGYPNNAGGFQGDMSDEDFRAVTQCAVYCYTNNWQGPISSFSAAQKEAVNKFLYNSIPDTFDNAAAEDVLSRAGVYKTKKSGMQYLFTIPRGVTQPPVVEPKLDAPSTSFTPCAKKTLEGGTLAAGQFTFDLYENGQVIDTATNDADGNIVFKAITYDGVGTHTYTIKERNDNQTGVKYDTNEKTFTVKATAHDLQTYDENATYYGRETYDYRYMIGTSPTDQGIQMFCTNKDSVGPQDASAANQTYSAVINPSTIVADADAAKGSMVHSNRYGSDAELQENLRKIFYYFETDDAEQFPSDMRQKMVWYATGIDSKGDGETYNVNGVSVKASKDANGIKNLLDAIYKTVEAPAGYNLVFFLPSDQQIANNCPQPLATGYGTVVSYESGTPTFVNSIAAQSTKVSLDGVKTLTGGDLADGQFSFKIEGSKGLSKTVKNKADGTIDFGDIEYTADDFGKTFTYTITEIAGDNADVVYDTTAYKVTVELSADGKATVKKVKVSGAEESVKDDKTYSSTLGTAGDGSFNHALNINGEVAYCFNKDKEWPENGDTSEGYKKYENVSSADVQKFSTSANKDAILKAVYNGYPYDGAKLKDKYGLNDAQMQGITQVALWVATEYGSIDKIGNAAAQNGFVAGAIGNLQFGTNNSFWSQNPDEATKHNMYKCLADMTGWTYSYYAKASDLTKTNYVGDTSALKNAPAGLALNLYIHPDNLASGGTNAGNTQNLLSVGKLVENPPAATEEPADKIAFANSIDAGPKASEVTFSKVNLGGKEIGGAEIQIFAGEKAEGEVVSNWTSVEGENKTIDLKPGTYTFHEEVAPEGYKKVTDIVFSVDEKGTVEVKSASDEAKVDENGTLVVTDDYQARKVKFSKTDLGGNELAGADITVSGTVKGFDEGDDAGKVSESWKSDGTAKELQLKPGAYKMVETAAPEGYEIATEIEFTVNLDGTITVDGTTSKSEDKNIVTMVDGYAGHDILFSKINLGGEEIGGAEITVSGTELHGKEIEDITWTSVEGDSTKITLKPGTYTFHEETAPEGYKAVTDIVFTVAIDGTIAVIGNDGNEVAAEDGKLTVTDQYDDTKVSVEGTKTWKDAFNQDGKRPGSVEVALYNGDQKVDAKTVTAADKWQYSFTDLPKYTEGVLNDYKVKEENVPEGYTASVDGTNVTNTHEVETISVEGAKTWVDADDQSKRPESIEVQLYADGEFVKSQTVKAGDNGEWKYKFENLPKYAEKKATQAGDPAVEVKYTVAEKMVDGYATDVKGTNVINTRSEKTAVHVQKAWNDTNDADGKRPGSVTVHLFANGEDTNKTLELNADNNWHAHFTDLDGFDGDGAKIAYTVTEDEVDGYETEIAADEKIDEADAQGVSHAYRIVNTHEAEQVSVSGTKIWDDGDDANKLRPESITVELYADGEPYASAKVAVNDKGEWKYSFDNLIKNHAGKEVVYTVKEKAAPEGYTSTVDGSDITNKHEVTHDIKVSKVDLGGKEIEGAQISVKNADGSLIKAWKSGKDAETIALTKGEYLFHETVAPEGYTVVTDIKFTVDENGKVTVISTDVQGGSAEGGDNALTVTDDYQARKVKFSKTDLGGNELAGADITVSGTVKGFDEGDDAGKVSESWKSDGTAKELQLKPGTYKMVETAAPEGYEIATEIEFTVNLDGTITVDGTTSKSEDKNVVTMVDDYTVHNVAISKTDLGGKEIEGAKITVSGSDLSGKKVEKSWTSGEDKDDEGILAPHTLGLKPGTYTFHEEVAPEGYTVVTDIEFEVGLDGKVTVTSTDVKGGSVTSGDKSLKVTDGYQDQTVTVSKTDINGTEELEGAQLVIKKEGSDEELVSWTSGDDGKDVDGKVNTHKVSLQPGTYVLTETTAPKGYKVAESITFTVNHLGKVTIGSGDDAVEAENGVVNMKDDYADGKVIISKTDVAGKEIAGAKLVITDKDGKTVKEWTSKEGENHEVELYPGTYTLTETAAPKGYEVAESITFTVEKDGKVTVVGEEVGKVTMVDAYSDQDVTFSKVDLGGKEIGGAQIVVFDKDGKVVDQWTSEEGKSHVAKLQPGTYVFHEEAAPEGYLAVTDITFTVDKDGVVKVVDAAGNTVKGGKDGKLTVTDQYDESVGGNNGGDNYDEGDNGNGGGSDGQEGNAGGKDGSNNGAGQKAADGNGSGNGGSSAKANASSSAAAGNGNGGGSGNGAQTGDASGLLGFAGIGCAAIVALGIALAVRRKMNR